MGHIERVFSGKVAFVTGAASGIGRELCQQLVVAGARVVAADIDMAGLSRLSETLGDAVRVEQLDVTSAEQVAAAIDSACEIEGGIDYLFNNAGIGVGGELQDCEAASLERILDINLKGATLVMHAAYRRMVQARRGHVVNIASMWGLCPAVMQSVYSATKHGLVALSLSVAPEAAQHGVRVTAVCPGYIRTGLFAAADYGGDMDADEALDRIPFDLIDVQTAVRRTLAGVARGRMLVIFPFYVRFMWWMQRLSPGLMHLIYRLVMRRQRAPR